MVKRGCTRAPSRFGSPLRIAEVWAAVMPCACTAANRALPAAHQQAWARVPYFAQSGPLADAVGIPRGFFIEGGQRVRQALAFQKQQQPGDRRSVQCTP